MKKLSLILTALGLALVMSAPAWALVDLSLSAEYVLNGKGSFEISGLGSAEEDLKGGTLVKGMFSLLGITAGVEYYADTVKEAETKITQTALKAGYGFGLPGFDLTALATYEQYKATNYPLVGDLTLNDILVGVDGVVSILPVFDAEFWYSTSVSGDVSSAALEGAPGLKSSGSNYGIRLIYDLAAGLGLSAGYRVEDHKVEFAGNYLKLGTKGYTLGVTYIF